MLDLRTALILLGTALVSLMAGGLQLADGQSWPAALFTAGTAGGVALGVLSAVIAKSGEHPKQTDSDFR